MPTTSNPQSGERDKILNLVGTYSIASPSWGVAANDAEFVTDVLALISAARESGKREAQDEDDAVFNKILETVRSSYWVGRMSNMWSIHRKARLAALEREDTQSSPDLGKTYPTGACPTCGGSGSRRGAFSTEVAGFPQRYPCPECHGKGREDGEADE